RTAEQPRQRADQSADRRAAVPFFGDLPHRQLSALISYNDGRTVELDPLPSVHAPQSADCFRDLLLAGKDNHDKFAHRGLLFALLADVARAFPMERRAGLVCTIPTSPNVAGGSRAERTCPSPRPIHCLRQRDRSVWFRSNPRPISPISLRRLGLI